MADFSPAILDGFALQLKNALKLAENVPQYVLDDAERFRQSIRKWSDEMKNGKKVSNG